jgi:antitoxin (DNA-binding transcriptional repressor) of toxin-antitoxin stability system
MKTITLSEAKAHLRHYGQMCYLEPFVVTVDGIPLFQIVPVEEEDDALTNRLLEHNAEFHELLKARAGEPEIPAEDAAKML